MNRPFFPPILLLSFAIVVSLGGFADAAPPPPAHLALTAAPLAGQVGLQWDAAVGATSYRVQRTADVTQSLVPGSDNGITQQWKAVIPAEIPRRFVHLKVTRP